MRTHQLHCALLKTVAVAIYVLMIRLIILTILGILGKTNTNCVMQSLWKIILLSHYGGYEVSLRIPPLTGSESLATINIDVLMALIDVLNTGLDLITAELLPYQISHPTSTFQGEKPCHSCRDRMAT